MQKQVNIAFSWFDKLVIDKIKSQIGMHANTKEKEMYS